jgi:hypothetical protein
VTPSLIARIYNGLDERRGYPVIKPKPQIAKKKPFFTRFWNWLTTKGKNNVALERSY